MTEEFFKYIDIDRTIAEFGYDPRTLSVKSARKVWAACSSCGKFRLKVFHTIDRLLCKACACKKRFNEEIEQRATNENPEIVKFINVERTIEEFGYDPRKLKKQSGKLVWSYCTSCNSEVLRQFNISINRNCKSCGVVLTHKVIKQKREKLRTVHDPELLSMIDCERTKKEFGYEVNQLSERSSKKVYFQCSDCGDYRPVSIRLANAKPKCYSCSNSFRNKTEEAIRKQKEGIRLAHERRSPEEKKILADMKKAENLSEETRRKLSEANRGRKHSEETKRRLREIQSNRPPITEETRKKLSIASAGRKHSEETKDKMRGKNNPRYGKPAAHGKGQWHTKPDGTRVYFRSPWEYKYAKYLDSQGKEWKLEAKVFEVRYLEDGKIKDGTYRPDFLVDGKWFEVKGWWRGDAQPKFEAFLDQYPEENVTLLMAGDLLALGIKLDDIYGKAKKVFGQDFIDNHRANKKLAA